NYTSSIINPLMMFIVDGLDTYDQAIKAFDQISRYGLDSLTLTALFEFISKMNERDILTNEKLGVEWKQDFKTFQYLIDIIAKREGFGDILADGWKKLAMEDKTFSNEMLTVKGLDVIFEPRFLRLGTMEFEQVVNPKGAHVASGGSPTYVGAGGNLNKMKSHFNRMGIPETAFSRIFIPPNFLRNLRGFTHLGSFSILFNPKSNCLREVIRLKEPFNLLRLFPCKSKSSNCDRFFIVFGKEVNSLALKSRFFNDFKEPIEK
ncbi:unnamed protein product, partial [marine sediment metagenome]